MSTVLDFLIPVLTFFLGNFVGAGLTAYYAKKKLEKLKQNPMNAVGDMMSGMMQEMTEKEDDDLQNL